MLLLAAAVLTVDVAEGRAEPAIAVVRALPMEFVEADAAREGAAEFFVAMEIARVSAAPMKGGVVGVGNRRGRFSGESEEALRRAALRGVLVVKLAPGGAVEPAPHGLFLDGTGLSEEEACRVLAKCLQRFGPPPAAERERATKAELAKMREHLNACQQEFSMAAAARVAAK